jgi:hypothetical protein
VLQLRRYYHHQLRHHQRFHVAVLLTIVVVAYVVVPAVASFFESVGGYRPTDYEPKDAERQSWLVKQDRLGLGALGWDDLVKIVLLLLAGVAWLAVAPIDARPPRRSRR